MHVHDLKIGVDSDTDFNTKTIITYFHGDLSQMGTYLSYPFRIHDFGDGSL